MTDHNCSSGPTGDQELATAVDVLVRWFDLDPDRAAVLLTTWACEWNRAPGELAGILIHDSDQGCPPGHDRAVIRRIEDRLRAAPVVAR